MRGKFTVIEIRRLKPTQEDVIGRAPTEDVWGDEAGLMIVDDFQIFLVFDGLLDLF